MSETEGEQPPLARAVLRTVTPPFRSRGDTEMSAIGWTVFLGVLLLLLPLLPFMLLIWLFGKLLDRAAAED